MNLKDIQDQITKTKRIAAALGEKLENVVGRI